VNSTLAEHLTPPRRVGLLAGWGRYPVIVAQALKRQGCYVCCLGVKDHADPYLAQLCDEFSWLGLAKLGRAVRFFRRHGVRYATMSGKIHKVRLYQPWLWLKHLPDLYMIKTFYPHFITRTKDRRDDTLLGSIVDAFAAHNITFGPATDLVPELLAKEGLLTGRPPGSGQRKDVQFGWLMAKKLGELDIGQSVCVKDQAVLAVEAIEGTDACIRRAGELCAAGGFTVVKVAKPQQDMRFDVPTIGLGTLVTMAAAGGRLLAIEAGRTILLDESKALAFAAKKRITIVAIRSEAIGQFAA